MIKYLKKKHKELFSYIPLTLPIILVGIILMSLSVYYYFDKLDGFLINLITELIGILVTIYLVTYLLVKEEKGQWREIKEIVEEKYANFIYLFYSVIASSIDMNLTREFDYLNYLQNDLSEVKKNIDEKIEESISNFTGKDIDGLITRLQHTKVRLGEIIRYIEKRPFFMQDKELFEIDNKLDKIFNRTLMQKLFQEIKSDIKISESSKNYTEELIKEIKEILEKLFAARENIKRN